MTATAAALLGGEDADLDRLAARLLLDDGIVVDPDAPVAVVLCAGSPGARLRALRGALAHGPRDVVSLMPAGVGNAVLRKAMTTGARGIVFDAALARTLAPTVRAVA